MKTKTTEAAFAVAALGIALAATACGAGSVTSTSQPRVPAAALAASSAAAAARAKGAAPTTDASNGTAADVCPLLTVDEVGKALGHPMKTLEGAPGLCAFQATDPANPDPVMLSVIRDTIAINDTRATYTSVNATTVPDLGDEALWVGPISEMFVRKGDVAFTIVDGSQIANLTAGTDNAPSQARLTQLASIVLSRI